MKTEITMEKFYNTAGPCNEKQHFGVPILQRNTEIMSLIKREQYFVLHAARQTGKTTLIKTFVNKINKEKKYYALYCSLEAVQVFVEPKEGLIQIINVLKEAIVHSNIPKKEKFAENAANKNQVVVIKSTLVEFCKIIDKPLIIFFDEVDGLQNGTLVSFLQQLRSGYVNRPEIPFVHSVALVGMRDIRDYKSKIIEGQQTLGSKSPFNIIEKSFTLENFTKKEISKLYQQHTDQTGQIFEQKAIEFIFQQSDGQPWLVNAIAKECIAEILKDDYSKPITQELAKQAIQNIILRRDTHIDSLLAKLKEKRVQEIIEPILITTKEKNTLDFTSDNLQYCKDLGLIKETNDDLKPANPIYSEIIIRELTNNSQKKLKREIKNTWINEKKEIDMHGLLKAFQVFWRENSTIWVEKYQYKEAAPRNTHLGRKNLLENKKIQQ